MTQKTVEELWQDVVNFKKPLTVGCEKCTNGTILVPKESGFGFYFEACGCWVDYESLQFSRELFKFSNLSKGVLMRYNVKNWKPLDNLSFDDLKNIVLSSDAGNNWLFLYGGPGSGKTFSAVLACQIALLQERSVYFAPVAALLDDLRPNPSDQRRSKFVSYAVKNVDVLVLDDIGHEKSSEWVREQLYIIINQRWNDGKCIIFTSNFKVDNLKTTVSEAVYSRVKGDAMPIHFKSIDQRLIT